jgi:DNA polymerase I-like protein with 3'-5' exonuclease and polymerase domains
MTIGEAVLEKLRKMHPVVSLLLQHRSLIKLEHTFIAKLKGHSIRRGKCPNLSHVAVCCYS